MAVWRGVVGFRLNSDNDAGMTTWRAAVAVAGHLGREPRWACPTVRNDFPWPQLQIPRLYNVYKETGVIEDFQQMLDNIFEPLFEVTADPSTHPQLHVLLQHVSES